MPESMVAEPSMALVALLGLAFFGLLALGFYDRRQSHRFNLEVVQRLSMSLQTAVTRSAAAAPAPERSPFPQGPPPAAPFSSDLSDEGVWNQVNAEWAREDLLSKQRDEARASFIQERLREAQAKKAAALAAEGKLGDFPEAAEQSAPNAASS